MKNTHKVIREAFGFALLISAFAASAQSMYRCGNTFSQQPCAPDAKEQALPRSATGSGSGGQSELKATNETERLNKLIDGSQKERRRWDVRDRLLPNAQAALAQHKKQCEATQARLAAEQYEYVQNMYGKTHAAQKASEMAAEAAKCGTKERELTDELNKLTKECELTNCKRF